MLRLSALIAVLTIVVPAASVHGQVAPGTGRDFDRSLQGLE